jgi:hypothetical protein
MYNVGKFFTILFGRPNWARLTLALIKITGVFMHLTVIIQYPIFGEQYFARATTTEVESFVVRIFNETVQSSDKVIAIGFARANIP